MAKEKLLKILKVTSKVILWIAGIWLALLIILQIVLSTPVLTKIVNSYAADYIDGDIHFGKVSISMFSKFPRAELTFEDFSVTYPTERYEKVKDLGAQGHLMNEGCGEKCDTLASFSNLSASINLTALLTGNIKIPHLDLQKPRIFVHRYADGCANLEIFVFEEDEEDDDTGMPEITFGEIKLRDNPYIVYSDSKDTLFACIRSKQILVNGKLDMQNLDDRKIGLTIDSSFVAGRMVKDTLAVGINTLLLHEDSHNRSVNIDTKFDVFAGTEAYGRIRIPVDINGKVSFPQSTVPAVNVDELNMNIAHIPIHTEGEVYLKNDTTSVRASIEIPECDITNIKEKFVARFIPEVKKITTDAKISMLFLCDGDYIHETRSLPPILAQFIIPDSKLEYADFPDEKLTFNLEVNAETDTKGKLNVDLTDFNVKAKGLDIYAGGNVKDLMKNDPSIQVDGGVYAHIDSLKRFIPESLGVVAKGSMLAMVKGKARLSQLNLYNFSESSLTGELMTELLEIDMPTEGLSAKIKGLEATLGPEKRKTRRNKSKELKLVGISGKAAQIDVDYKDVFNVDANDLSFSAKNVTSSPTISKDNKKSYPFSGRIRAKKFMFKDSEGTSLILDNTGNSFRVTQKRDKHQTPVLSLTSNNKKIFAKSDINRVMLNDAKIKVRAEMKSIERKAKIEAFKDSLARVYPDIPRDSLFRHVYGSRRKSFTLPEWLSEEDFRKQDINIALDETLAKYFREWDLDGSLEVSQGRLITPYFPLSNVLDTFDLKFTNDEIAINRLGVFSGKSNLSVTGSLKGLRRALLGRKGALRLDISMTSDSLKADQLFTAYVMGSNVDEKVLRRQSRRMSDEEYLESIIIDSTTVIEQTPLIVVPANLIADISLNANKIEYSDLNIDSLTTTIAMKERCIQLTNTHAITNMGDVSLEAFYSTRTKKDLKTGFSIEFKDLTAEKAINMMPGLDTIVPLLKSFDGLINCEVAATTQFDTDMNLLTPSINGIIRISGENLSIKDNEYFSDLAKTLMFKNKKEGHVDKMMVEGIIKDSKFEIFPFILEIDRYRLGLSGVQNMDMSYRYHASVLKSPLLFRFGVDIYGDDFDNWKFKICKAKYKNVDIPTFSAVIDQTKINLVESIRNIFAKGVENVMEENKSQTEIVEHREKIGYVQAVDQEAEELTEEEKKEIEKELKITTFEKK